MRRAKFILDKSYFRARENEKVNELTPTQIYQMKILSYFRTSANREICPVSFYRKKKIHWRLFISI